MLKSVAIGLWCCVYTYFNIYWYCKGILGFINFCVQNFFRAENLYLLSICVILAVEDFLYGILLFLTFKDVFHGYDDFSGLMLKAFKLNVKKPAIQ